MKNLVKSMVVVMMVAFVAACADGAAISAAKQKAEADASRAGAAAQSAEAAAQQAQAAAQRADAGATEGADSSRRANDAVARLEAAFSSSVTK
ncbi:MAG: hypothetical protein ABSC63_01670 [Candidatus Binataceae bacterium]|jgi:type II secretory pathway pseudopilin PulG